MVSLSRQDVYSSLHYGYTIDLNCVQVPHPIPEKQNISHEKAVNEGSEIIETVFDDLIRNSGGSNRTHIIPLSSGLDSRFILGELLKSEKIANEQIKTISFGTPGTWDYEIPRQISSKLGVSHRAIDLTNPDFWKPDEIRDYVRNLNGVTRILNGFANAQVPLTYSNNECIYWSGFLSSELAGAHFPQMPSKPTNSWEEACQWFVRREHRTNQDIQLPDFDPITVLPDSPIVDAHPPDLRYEEQLDYGIRMQCFVQRAIRHPCYSDHYIEPFTHPNWVKYILSLSEEMRSNRKIFMDIFKARHPKLASFPTDANYGLPIFQKGIRQKLNKAYTKFVQRIPKLEFLPNPNINYINFADAFRDHPHLSNLMTSAAVNFDNRNLIDGISAQNLLESHRNGGNNTQGLRTILSLELYLQTH